MKLIALPIYCIEYQSVLGFDSVLIEASSFAEAEQLFKENFENCTINSINKYCTKTYRKSTKTINIEV